MLVVDNNEDTCRIISDVLEEEGLHTNTVYDGDSALKSLKKHPHDVMILDYRLPGISGLTVLERAREIRPKTRVIMISGFGDSSTKLRAKELGACDFLDKPFNIRKLVRVVKKCLKKQVN